YWIASLRRAARWRRSGDRGRLLHRLLPALYQGNEPGNVEGAARFFVHRGDPTRRRSRANRCRRDPRISSGRSGRRSEKLGTRVRRLYKGQRDRDSASSRESCGHTDPTIYLRVELVSLRRQRASALSGERLSAAAFTLWRHKARGRAPGEPLLGKSWRAGRVA